MKIKLNIMAHKKRNGVKFPSKFMREMKKQKKKKIRNTPVNKEIVEQKFNNAERVL